MKITSPCVITPRLLPGVELLNGTERSFVSISREGVCDDRTIYRYYIDTPHFSYENNDLRSGIGNYSLQAGLESLLSFLSACAESHAYDVRRGGDGSGGENSDLFPANVREWAYMHNDEIGSLQYELAETKDLIVE